MALDHTIRALPTIGPFGGETNAAGFVTNAMGLSFDPTYSLLNASVADPDTDQRYFFGGSRHNAYSINMLSPMAAPEWAGELFYKSVTGGGTNDVSGNGPTSASEIMQSADWQSGLPQFAQTIASAAGVMISEGTHNTTIKDHPSVWRPLSFNGSNQTVSLGQVTMTGSDTGGYVSDGKGHYFRNTMAWSSRPTHYYDFSQSKWVPVADNHNANLQALPLGIWKSQEYAWHARALGVTIYTVGYGNLVSPAQCALLAQIANSTNVLSPDGSGGIQTNDNPFNPNQPIGQQFYATTPDQISNDFYSVGQAINEALTGGH